MEERPEGERLTYLLCRAGFGTLSFGLIVASVSTLLSLPGFFGRGMLPSILNTEFWFWLDSTIPWTCLFGTYLLWGRWDHPSWQRRTGLLLVLNLIDVLLWTAEHGGRMGLEFNELGHDWLRHNVGQAIGWAEFSLLASLSGDMLVHLGVEKAPEAAKATRSLAATGAVVWLLLFMFRTDWRRGWPIGQRGFLNPEMLLLYFGSTIIWTVTLVQVTSLAVAATRQCHEVLTEIAKEEEAVDLFQSPSDGDRDRF